MEQLNFIEKGKVEWREADAPKLEGDGEALVRPLAVSTCDLDTALILGMAPLEGPFPIGHECVAEVTDVGDAVSSFKPGDLVSVPFQISCGECDRCKRGQTGHCTGVPRMSMYGLGPLSGGEFGGFLSDSARVPFAEHMLVAMPDGVDPVAAASVSDNIVDSWRTVGPQLAEQPGAEVLVISGTPSLGLYSAGLAVTLGASRVDVLGLNPAQAEAARTLGANVIEGPTPERLGPYPIVVNASSEVADLACALRSTEPDGICTSSGVYFMPETPVPLLEMYTKGITFVTGRCHARPAIPEVLELIAAGKFDPAPVTAQVVEWGDAAEALSSSAVKTVISRAGNL